MHCQRFWTNQMALFIKWVHMSCSMVGHLSASGPHILHLGLLAFSDKMFVWCDGLQIAFQWHVWRFIIYVKVTFSCTLPCLKDYIGLHYRFFLILSNITSQTACKLVWFLHQVWNHKVEILKPFWNFYNQVTKRFDFF